MQSSQARCAKVIMFKAAAGKIEEYDEYLRTAVEPIDHQAKAEGALVDMMTLVNRGSDSGQPWTHLRIFLFESEAQRAGVKDVFARILKQLHPGEPERKARKEYGDSLRTMLSELDVGLLG